MFLKSTAIAVKEHLNDILILLKNKNMKWILDKLHGMRNIASHKINFEWIEMPGWRNW